MPPGSEAFVTALLNTVLSQYGALVSVLFIVIWYLSRELSKERAAHDVTTGKLLTSAEESTKAGMAVASALTQLKDLVERIAERTVYDRRGQP